MKKLITPLPLLMVLMSMCFSPAIVSEAAEAVPEDQRFEKDIAAFEAADRKQMPPENAVLFIGSSSIRMWKSLANDFPEHRVINRGFGGSHVRDSTRVAERIVFPYRPRQIVFYAGDNDLAGGRSPEQVLADFKAFVEKVHAKLPETRIDFIAIKPSPSRWKLAEKQRVANRMVEEYTKTNPGKLGYIDIFTPMLDEKGVVREDLFLADRLHLNEKGYAMWVPIVKGRLMGEKK